MERPSRKLNMTDQHCLRDFDKIYPPELASLLVTIRQLDERRQNFFYDPGALLFMISKDLRTMSCSFESV
jgi:hypothetical protein